MADRPDKTTSQKRSKQNSANVSASGRKPPPKQGSTAAKGRKPSPNETTKARSSKSSVGSAGRRDRMQRNSTVLVVALLSVFVLGGLAIHPIRTWLSQREQMAETEAELTEVRSEVAELERQLELLETDEEVERRARGDFYLVYPGEESYRILPGPDQQEPQAPSSTSPSQESPADPDQ